LAFEDMGSGFSEFQDVAGFVKLIQRFQEPQYWQTNVDRGLAQLSAQFDRETIFKTFAEFLASSRRELPNIRRSLTGRLLRHHGAQSIKYFSQWIEEKNKNRSARSSEPVTEN